MDHKPSANENVRKHVYDMLCRGLRSGLYAPGEKLTIRTLATRFGVSPTPVREALHRLSAEGVLVAEAEKTARVAQLSGDQLLELRDVRLVNECLAARRAAERDGPAVADQMRQTAARLDEARARGDSVAESSLMYEFQFQLYEASRMPTLVELIKTFWLRTGPYLKLFGPDYVADHAGWRDRLCDALERGDADAVEHEVRHDLTDALGYLATLVDAARFLSRH